MKLKSLEDALVEELQDLLSAETQLTEALPKMAENAAHPDLKAAFEEHLDQTSGHIERLHEVFELLGQKAESKTCEAMQGLVKEGESILEEQAEPEVRDAMLIAAAQKVEHYEIASYGTVLAWAQSLGHEDVLDLLEATLAEERETDERLTDLAESVVNVEAQ